MTPEARRVCWSEACRFPVSWREDLYQEARIRLWLTGIADDSAAARMTARSACLDAWRSWHGRGERGGVVNGEKVTLPPTARHQARHVPLESRPYDPEARDDPAAVAVSNVQVERIVAALNRRLDERERAAVLARLHGTQKALADAWGVHESRVSQIRRQALVKLAA